MADVVLSLIENISLKRKSFIESVMKLSLHGDFLCSHLSFTCSEGNYSIL